MTVKENTRAPVPRRTSVFRTTRTGIAHGLAPVGNSQRDATSVHSLWFMALVN